MFRPTSRALAYFTISVPLAAVIINAGPNLWPWALAYPVLISLIALWDMSRALPANKLTFELKAPPTLFVGVEEKALLTISAHWPGRAQLEIRLETDGPAKFFGSSQVELADNKAVSPIPILGYQRGLIDLKALWLRWPGPLGLVQIRVKRPLSQQIAVSQNTHRLHQDTVKILSRQALIGQKPLPFRGEGAEFESLTEFVPGMDPRRVDWKRSGRHRKLLAREYHQERNHLIVFGFDTGRLMLEPVAGVTKLDHFVAAALRLGWVSLKNGDLVGGCGYDLVFRSFLKPGRGPKFFNRLRAFTANLSYRHEETNHTLALAELMSRLPHRSLVVLFTEFIDDISAELLLESLAPLTRRHMVIFVTVGDPILTTLSRQKPHDLQTMASAVLADNFAKNRELVLNRVRRLGVHCLDTPAHQITAALLSRYLLIKQRGLL
ncbi:MAG: DUF58 domain-containing protein [Deltaproteobacteria bacterium]|jgi:uncharacterized protein (DUF58 family)|nr:DUF58 domain-containing protein [Deltaproteobacteria bacterium]